MSDHHQVSTSFGGGLRAMDSLPPALAQDSTVASVDSSRRGNTTNTEGITHERVSSAGLKGSLQGLLQQVWFLVLSSTYPQFKNTKDDELTIDPESARRDLKRMFILGDEIVGVCPSLLCDTYGEGYHHAKAKRILKTMKDRPHELSGLIYMALHSAEFGGGYMAADYPNDPPPGSKQGVIRDSEIRKSLLIPGSGPLLLVVEACNCTNILELPLFLECVDGEVQQYETNIGKRDWTLEPPRIQFCATTPDHKAIWFPSTGGLFTQAFYNLFRRTDLSLRSLLKEMQALVDKQILAAGSKDQDGNLLSQRLRVYFSGANHPDENIWSIVGVTLKPVEELRDRA